MIQENPRINKQDRQKITFHGSANPKEISQQCTPATHTEAVHCQRVLLEVFHLCLWPLKAPGSTLGRVAKPRQLSDASTPTRQSVSGHLAWPNTAGGPGHHLSARIFENSATE